MAVAAVERAEMVDVEEHKRESLLSTEGWKRGDEFAVVGEPGQTIHVSIIGRGRAEALASASLRNDARAGGGLACKTVGDVNPSRRGRAAFFLATGGVACALALLPVAFFAPVYSGESGSSSGTVATTDTLVGVNGVWVIWLLCIPVFLALTAW